MILMLREILKNYVDKVAPKVDMKNEKEIAERYLGYVKSNSEMELEKAK
jgi:hypothetical protein